MQTNHVSGEGRIDIFPGGMITLFKKHPMPGQSLAGMQHLLVSRGCIRVIAALYIIHRGKQTPYRLCVTSDGMAA